MPGYERTPFFSFQSIFNEQPTIAAFVTTDTAQSIPDAVATVLSFASPILTDRLGTEAHRTLWKTAAPGQFVITVRGIYLFGASSAWSAAPIQGLIQMEVNSIIVARQDVTAPGAIMAVTACYPLVAGDVVQAKVYQDSAGAQNTLITNELPNMWIVRIGG